MAQQKIVWTALPHGRVTEGLLKGRWRVSLVASPRLTPQKQTEKQLGAFEALLHWPETLLRLRLGVQIDGKDYPLEPLLPPDSVTWQRLFDVATPVAGFQFKDMSQVNLRSFPVRNVLGFARRHYAQLATASGARHPALLPYRKGGALEPMLKALGTQVDERGSLLPGFERFHPRYVPGKNVVVTGAAEYAGNSHVFSAASDLAAPEIGVDGTLIPGNGFRLRALPPDWEDPAQSVYSQKRAELMGQFASADEYSFYQADRFYRRSTPTVAGLRMRRPDFKDQAPDIQTPEFDFHRIVASYGDYPVLLRALGLVIDCVLPEGTVLDGATDDKPRQGRMLAVVRGSDSTLVHSCLQTAWQASASRFTVAARTSDHQNGLLALSSANDRHDTIDQQAHDDRAHSHFDVYQVDPDGTAVKTVNYLLTAQNLIGKSLLPGADGSVTYTTGDDQPVAALRSAGLGVSRHGRAGVVAMDARAAALKNAAIEESTAAAAKVVLFAEDVLRGYRVDVQTVATGRWLSLCERTGQYRVVRDGGPLDLPAHRDEGYVKSASTTGNGKDDDHYLHESVFRWAGWSLVAPRPGRTLVAENDAGLQTERVATPGEDADLPALAEQGNGIDVRFAARKGSLPRLRFGETYRFRARITDLAGNSLALDDRSLGKEEQASDPVKYARFEPVDPPALVLQGKLSEGESLERMVIRSNFDAPASTYLQVWRSFYTPEPAGSGLSDFAYRPVNLRHVVPPKAAQTLCEHHGCFDAGMGSDDPALVKKAYAVAARESGSLLDNRPDAQVELITPQNKRSVATVAAPGALITPPDQADPTRDRFAAGQYVLHREELVPIPYLPDPAAGGIALHGVPGLARMLAGRQPEPLAPGLEGLVLERGVRAARVPLDDKSWIDLDLPGERFRWILLIDFDSDVERGGAGSTTDSGWPDDRQSLRIALHDQPDEVASPACTSEHTFALQPQWDAGTRTLHLSLPQGRIARLQYATFVHDQYLAHMGLPQWVDHPGAADAVRAAALAGAHWMVTPFRRLVLVHATQQPVCAPVLMHAYPSRRPGSTFVDLFGKDDNIALHGPSTGKIQVMAQWSEWVDDPAQDDPQFPGPRRVKFKGALGEIRLADNHANVFCIESAVEAQRALEAGAGTSTPPQLAARANAPGNRHEFGDTRFRQVRYHLHAATRFREYLPPELYAKPEYVSREGEPLDQSALRVLAANGDVDTDPGAPLLPDGASPGDAFGLVIPASSPPAPPQIVYTLPTFHWSRAGAGKTLQTSTRQGNALRVYLDRPWFSSGDGEMLAVIVAPLRRDVATPFTAIDQAISDRVTQWGLDPMWDSRNPGADAEPADFPLRVAQESIKLPDGAPVLAVAHRVVWSDDRQLWFSDIEINTGQSYMPFVRLALARYQPNALLDARLSLIVLADFAQVLPYRRAQLQRDGDGRVSVSLHGPVPTRGPMRDKRGTSKFNDAPFTDGGFAKSATASAEMGENRVELVLQTRDPAIDSDLAWRDAGVLAGGPAVATSGLVAAPRKLMVDGGAVQFSATEAINLLLKTGRSVRFDRAEPQDLPQTRTVGKGLGADKEAERSSAKNAAARLVEVGGIGSTVRPFPGGMVPLLDPAIWEHSAALPATGSAPARLVLREFERYYTDRSVPELRINTTTAGRRRRVVEERLVYSEFFDV